MTYNIKELYKKENCENCYNIWKDVVKIKDSRNIVERVFDILK